MGEDLEVFGHKPGAYLVQQIGHSMVGHIACHNPVQERHTLAPEGMLDTSETRLVLESQVESAAQNWMERLTP
jgi:hypothetical protein